MIGAPTNFKHTVHIGSSDVGVDMSKLHVIHGQMQSKGGYETSIEVTIVFPINHIIIILTLYLCPLSLKFKTFKCDVYIFLISFYEIDYLLFIDHNEC